jgi:hypothetical protein
MASAICAAFCAAGIGASEMDAVQQSPTAGVDQTVQFILNVINIESGATRSVQSEDTTWAYSATFTNPCTLDLTEERQNVHLNNAADGAPIVPIRQRTHYLIPTADLEFGSFSTHHTLEQGFMRVIIFTKHATIRRWYGDSSTAPEDAQVVFEASINFGKPDVDIFNIPSHFENALEHLTHLCQCQAKEETDPIRPR